MENSASTLDAPKISPSVPVFEETQAVTAPVKAPDAAVHKTPSLAKFNRFIEVITYPAALVAGMWMVDRDVNATTYHNLKRYGAFDDILHEGKGGGLVRRNKANVQDRVHSKIDIPKFHEQSHATRNEFIDRTSRRMAHMGLGTSYKNFKNKWDFVGPTGQSDALLKGATWTGIVAVVLSVANSAKLIEMFTGKEEDKGQSR